MIFLFIIGILVVVIIVCAAMFIKEYEEMITRDRASNLVSSPDDSVYD